MENRIKVQIENIFIDPNSGAPIVFLVDEERKIVLPIWIGFLEAQSMFVYLNKFQPPRPLTIDLLIKILTEDFGATVKEVEICNVLNGIFYAQLYFDDKMGKEFIRDCRPSDAISIALALKIPIYINKKVIDSFKPAELKNFQKMLEYLQLEESGN
jgi:bifunctional DNase/RNase